MVGHLGYSAILLFLNVKFTDSSSKMSRTVKKSIKRFIQIQYIIAFWSVTLEPAFLIYLFIYLFSVQIRNQHLPNPTFRNSPTSPPFVGRWVRIPLKAKSKYKNENIKFLESVFFSYIIYYKILSVFLQQIFRSAKFIFRIIY